MTTLLLLALALSMDAFAAAVTQGAAVPQGGAGRALGIGTLFGVFQGSMPLIGWGLGVAFAPIVRELDHWIAFVLLAFIGARMIRAGLAKGPVEVPTASAGRWVLSARRSPPASMRRLPVWRCRCSARGCSYPVR